MDTIYKTQSDVVGSLFQSTAEVCFICESQFEKGEVKPTSTSLQYLFRYVDLDLRKMFGESGSLGQAIPVVGNGITAADGKGTGTPGSLVPPFSKVLLCDLCSGPLQSFSQLYQLLEVVQMEMDYLLNQISGKLNTSSNPTENSLNPTQAVKKEMKKKCKIYLVIF